MGNSWGNSHGNFPFLARYLYDEPSPMRKGTSECAGISEGWNGKMAIKTMEYEMIPSGMTNITMENHHRNTEKNLMNSWMWVKMEDH